MAFEGEYMEEELIFTIKAEEIDILPEFPIEEESHVHHERPKAKSKKLAAPKRITNRCYLCSTVVILEDTNSLRKHLKAAHQALESYRCSECSLSFDWIYTYNRHLSRHDASERPHKCGVCPLRFYCRSGLYGHQVLAHGFKRNKTKGDSKKVTLKHLRRKLKCYLCPTDKGYDTWFDSTDKLHHHVENVHEEQTLYSCSNCDYSVDVITMFNHHLSRHDTSRNPYVCSTCTIGFSTPMSKRIHEMRAHGVDNGSQEYIARKKKQTFGCSFCEKTLKTSSALKLHELTKHRSEEIPKEPPAHAVKTDVYRCEECDYSSENSNDYTIHRAQHVPKMKEFKCSVCTRKFSYRRTKQQHEARKHKIENNSLYPCPDCGKKFANKTRLHECSKHLIFASRREQKTLQKTVETSTFPCTVCGKIFPNQRDKTDHELFVHKKAQMKNKLNLLQCFLCDTETILDSRSSLLDHLSKAHSSQSEYRCKLCRFTTKLVLQFNQHLSGHYASGRRSESSIRTPTPPSDSLCEIKTEVHEEEIDLHTIPLLPKNNFKCYLCGTDSPLEDRESLQNHLAAAHPRQDMYQCEKCGFSVSVITIFNQHLAQHYGAGFVQWDEIKVEPVEL